VNDERFHVEHGIVREWKERTGVILDDARERKLVAYAESIHETNKKFNITGFKNIEDILENLILGSIEPLAFMKVPRGTIFADMGTGAGIPGVPLAIYNDNWRGVCVDSNSKKVSFVDSVIRGCGIDNLAVINGRLEEVVWKQMREAFDYVFSRALGEIFLVIEVAAPLLKTGGLLYVYYNAAPDELHPAVLEHVDDVGLYLLERSRYREYGIREDGIVMVKKQATDNTYPRSMTAIRRDIDSKIKGS